MTITTTHQTQTTDFDVLIVGAGISGIGAAYHLKTRRPNTSFVVLEAHDSIGGTWNLFQYPGIRSDSDMPTFGYSFKPWTHCKSIADGHVILDYLQQTVTENGLGEHIRFGYRVLGAGFDSRQGRWTVTADHASTGETTTFTARFLFLGTGYYDHDAGFAPEFNGVEDFAGQVFNNRYWELSLLRLNQLNYFEQIKPENAELKKNEKAGTVDIKLKVKEKGKQSISFSGGVSGIAGTFVSLSYQTNNFLGLGETLTISGQLGNLQQGATFGFTEPYLFDRPISTGFTVFYSKFNYNQAKQEGLLLGQQVAIDPALQQNYTTDSHGFTMVEVSVERGAPATRLNPDDPWVTWAIASLERTTGKKTAVLPNLGGTLPNEVFAHTLGLPTIWVPHSYPACSQHAPNEHLLGSVAREGLQIMAGLFWDLGESAPHSGTA